MSDPIQHAVAIEELSEADSDSQSFIIISGSSQSYGAISASPSVGAALSTTTSCTETDLLDHVHLQEDHSCDVDQLLADSGGVSDDGNADGRVDGQHRVIGDDSDGDDETTSAAVDLLSQGHPSLYIDDDLCVDDEDLVIRSEEEDSNPPSKAVVVAVVQRHASATPQTVIVHAPPADVDSSTDGCDNSGGGGSSGATAGPTSPGLSLTSDHQSSVFGNLAGLDGSSTGSAVTNSNNNNSLYHNPHYHHHHHHNHHHHHQSQHMQPDQPDTKDGIIELCPVCGDRVSGYHYGLLTCESCKGFFKRTVQNKKVYTCVADKSCQIDKTQRKRCPFCRFQKCLDVGMKLEAVRVDRMRGGRNKFGPMYKRDRARKMQLVRQRQLMAPPGSQQLPCGLLTSQPTATRSLTSGDTASIYANSGGQLRVPSGGLNTATSLPISYNGSANNDIQTGAQHAVSIKQEIQYPVLSSTSASSPDSSPSPLACGLVNGASVGAPPGTNTGAPVPLSGSSLASGPASSATVVTVNQWTSGGGTATGTTSGNVVQPPPSTTTSTSSSTTAVVPSIIRELINSVDDRDWQQQLFGLLQTQTYNQCEVDLFELLCKVLDTNLFAQVDWARNSIFFKDLRVEDQMKLLQATWSVLLILDHIHQRIHNNLPDSTTMANGQKFDLLSLSLFGETQLVPQLQQLVSRLLELSFDVADYICLKFTLLLDPSLQSLTSRRLVHQAQNQVKQAHMQYCSSVHPDIPNKYQRLLLLLPDLRELALLGEEQLYQKHDTNSPTSLLIEMLHARRLLGRTAITACQP